tara:strand:+ start:1128 stop:1304 length:177 start_codon:yes stop_codon:yes gene_type:complete
MCQEHDMNYYSRYYNLPTYIRKEIKSKYDDPFTLEAVRYGENLFEEQIEEDIKTFKNY